MKQSTITLRNKQWPLIVAGIVVLALAASTGWAAANRWQSNQWRGNGGSHRTGLVENTQDALDSHGITPLSASQASGKSVTASGLAYMIEEEKLAHDVYQVLGDKWGSRIFSNIMRSEAMHQNMVQAVMESRGLTDPRSSKIGVFQNHELQMLYDQLIAQGVQSVSEAYKVGVAIEEKDIADLKQAIADLDAQDTDVKAVFENLLQGSENHLRAFSRQR